MIWKHTSMFVAFTWFVLVARLALADATVTVNHVQPRDAKATFKFATVAPPVDDDLATHAKFEIIGGERDGNGGTLEVLHDGKTANTADDPGSAFFFADRTTGGRIRVDLGKSLDVGQINTYSWHTGDRAPQSYRLYVADEAPNNFNAAPGPYVDPAQVGWTLLARVNTIPTGGEVGGQYGASVNDDDSPILAHCRYVLLEVSRVEADDAYGNTFFNEIDVIAPEKVRALKTVAPSSDSPYRISVETSNLPDDMKVWANERLEPVCRAWYPKIIEMLPSDGFQPPRHIYIGFKTTMGGTPAYTNGNRISCNLDWFTKNRNGESAGAVVHEMVHVVQAYKFGAKRTPFWLQEGIADYIRWYLYEPQSHGTRIRDASHAKYDAAYRISANFLNWVASHYDKDFVRKINAAVREGRYNDDLVEQLTGKTLDQLNAEWKATVTQHE